MDKKLSEICKQLQQYYLGKAGLITGSPPEPASSKTNLINYKLKDEFVKK